MQRTLLDYVQKVPLSSSTTTAAAATSLSPHTRSRRGRSPSTADRTAKASAADGEAIPVPLQDENKLTAAPSAARVRRETTLVDVDASMGSCSAISPPSSPTAAPSPVTPPQTSAVFIDLDESSATALPAMPAMVPRVRTSAADFRMHASSAHTSSTWLAEQIQDAMWRDFLYPLTCDGWKHGSFTQIARFLEKEAAQGKHILPPREDIFNAFNSCPFEELKVVLLGQDPYHDVGQAHGLSFSVRPGVRVPPSLRNMYAELTTDIPNFQAPPHGYLQHWAEQGMLLLNATLTVEAHRANAHSKTSGWQSFTDAVIARISREHPNRLVFLLWGQSAQQKKKLIDTRRHVVLESVHPSPLSAHRGWFGSHCFSTCDAALVGLGHTPMVWQLPMQVSGL